MVFNKLKLYVPVGSMFHTVMAIAFIPSDAEFSFNFI